MALHNLELTELEVEHSFVLVVVNTVAWVPRALEGIICSKYNFSIRFTSQLISRISKFPQNLC